MSKRILQHPATPADENTVSWRSSGQLRDTKEFRSWMDREFPRGAAELKGQDEQDTSRRTFLKLMGSSTALAGFGMVACRRPEAYLVPYTNSPEWVIPGKATYYASNMPRAGGAVPLVVTTYEGRPTKLAPNRLHPENEGTDAFAQASVLDMYSTSRSRYILKGGKESKRLDFQKVISELAQNPDRKIGFVFGADHSPTRSRLSEQLKTKFAGAQFYQYEALSTDNTPVLGEGVKIVPNFEFADKILSLDCDFSGTDPTGSNLGFGARRKPEGRDYLEVPDSSSMNRLYCVESAYSLTGGMADHRLRVAPSQLGRIAAQIAREVGADAGAFSPITDAKQVSWIKELAADLVASGGRTAVLAGSRQTEAVRKIALSINQRLGNIGADRGLQAYQTGEEDRGGIERLSADLNGGVIDTVVFLTPANPIYDAPADLDFPSALAKADLSIHLSDRVNATAHACTWHVPATHYLEAWADTRSARGVYSIVQPMILPLYADCISELELLLGLLADDGRIAPAEGEDGSPSLALSAVKETFAGDELAWKNLLRNGFAAENTYEIAIPTASASIETDDSDDSDEADEATVSSLDVIFATDASVYDGRWIDNGWLQEAPDPVTKLTWDNAALIAPKTAKALGIYDLVHEIEPKKSILGVKQAFADVGPDGEGQNRSAPMIKITVNGESQEFPVLISFGQAENTLILPLGYGQDFDSDDELGRRPGKNGSLG